MQYEWIFRIIESRGALNDEKSLNLETSVDLFANRQLKLVG